jgi:hypothetical protein
MLFPHGVDAIHTSWSMGMCNMFKLFLEHLQESQPVLYLNKKKTNLAHRRRKLMLQQILQPRCKMEHGAKTLSQMLYLPRWKECVAQIARTNNYLFLQLHNLELLLEMNMTSYVKYG